MGEWWQVASPIVSSIGVLVALGIALWGARQRVRDDRRAQLAEARLVRLIAIGKGSPPELDGFDAWIIWTVGNYGPQAIYDVRCEAWMWSNSESFDPDRPTWTATSPVVPSGESTAVLADFGPISPSLGSSLLTWRIRWSDSHGTRWALNGRDQTQDHPHHYRAGEVPPQHPGPTLT
jgi:hypothetical protein